MIDFSFIEFSELAFKVLSFCKIIDLIEFLSKYGFFSFIKSLAYFVGDNITLFLSGGLVLVTWRLVAENRRLVRENIKMRKATTRPNLSILAQPREDSSEIDIIIENVGQGTAYNLSFQVSKKFLLEDGEQLSNKLNQMPKEMVVNQRHQFFLVDMKSNKMEKNPYKFRIKAKYENEHGETYESRSMISLDLMPGLRTTQNDLHKVSVTMEKIRQDIHAIIEIIKLIVHSFESSKEEDSSEE